MRFYKFVREVDGQYFSYKHPDFEYKPGHVAVADSFDDDPNVVATHGIHMACLEVYASLFKGEIPVDISKWKGNKFTSTDGIPVAVLELAARLDEVVFPKGGNGIVRAPRAKVIRVLSPYEFWKEVRVSEF